FEHAQFAIGDDQEVPAATGRIEEVERRKLFMEGFQRLAPSAITPFTQAREFCAQVIEEKRFDHLQNVPLRRVMRALLPSLPRVHDRLEKRTEDRRRYCIPTEFARLYQDRRMACET